MNEVLTGRELLSDGPADDERWLRIIFEEAGPDPTFTIRRSHADVLVAQLAMKLWWDSASYEAAKTKADRISPSNASCGRGREPLLRERSLLLKNMMLRLVHGLQPGA
jgi:hypothetical protein